ncbi:MAG: hypothetical protein JXR37_22830, partial [Kiritimatiellae bacterium]|nr:hypothetical protein [Kiritimatiellia bacterium]
MHRRLLPVTGIPVLAIALIGLCLTGCRHPAPGFQSFKRIDPPLDTIGDIQPADIDLSSPVAVYRGLIRMRNEEDARRLQLQVRQLTLFPALLENLLGNLLDSSVNVRLSDCGGTSSGTCCATWSAVHSWSI